MLVSILMLLLISTGSIAGIVFLKKRYEEFIPYTCASLVLILFIFGLFGHIDYGFYISVILCVLTYIISCISLIRKKIFREFLHNLFTPAFFIFLVFLVGISFIDYGKMADGWDEFSHWADVVKVMFSINDFGTNPLGDSIFRAYPPSMALFQYFIIKLNSLFAGGQFVEWRLYFAYQVFVFSFFLPFFGRIVYKNEDATKDTGKRVHTRVSVTALLVSCVLAFVGPTIVYSDIYHYIYIDQFLGVLSGVGLATVLLSKEKKLWYSVQVYLICAMLVLAKASGIAFAALLAIIYMVDLCRIKGWKQWKSWGGYTAGVIAAVVVPKILWIIEMVTANVPLSGEKISILGFIQDILEPGSYSRAVVKSFHTALANRGVSIFNENLLINYISLLFVLFVILYLLLRYIEKRGGVTCSQRRILLIGTLIQTILFIEGICISYVTNFVEFEATNLASFERYVNTAVLAVLVLIICVLLYIISEYWGQKIERLLIILAITVMLSPTSVLMQYVEREFVHQSVTVREPYETIAKKARSVMESDSKVYFIAQETSGYEKLVMRYSLRPIYLDHNAVFSLGGPFFENDLYSKQISAKEWQQDLINNYDYVILFKLDSYFIENYACLFDDNDSISEKSIYRINKETGLLEICY